MTASSKGEQQELPLALSITFTRTNSTISLTLFNQPDETHSAIPLELKFNYNPSTPYAPIQELTANRNQTIKQVGYSLTHSLVTLPNSHNTTALLGSLVPLFQQL